MSDLAARIKDLTGRIDLIKDELTTWDRLSLGGADPDIYAALFFDTRAGQEKRLGELERELADLQGQVPATSADTSLDFPDILIPDAPIDPLLLDPFEGPPTATATATATAPTADRPRTQEKPGTGAKEPQPERPRTQEKRPRTQERPGTGTQEPKPEPRPPTIDDIPDLDEGRLPDAPAQPVAVGRNLRFGGRFWAAGFVTLLAVAFVATEPMRAPTATAPTSAATSAPAPAPTAPTATPAAAVVTPAPGPSAPTAASAGYRCVGGQKTLFDNSNGSVVTSGGTPPTFSTNGKTYCLVSVSTYHWNGGRGATPGRIGLIGGSGNVGPVQTKSGTGVPNADWVYVPEADARPLLDGQYTCTDSDPASWSQNEASGRLGFCRVFVQDAVKP